jgi:hypothetical protein
MHPPPPPPSSQPPAPSTAVRGSARVHHTAAVRVFVVGNDHTDALLSHSPAFRERGGGGGKQLGLWKHKNDFYTLDLWDRVTKRLCHEISIGKKVKTWASVWSLLLFQDRDGYPPARIASTVTSKLQYFGVGGKSFLPPSLFIKLRLWRHRWKNGKMFLLRLPMDTIFR